MGTLKLFDIGARGVNVVSKPQDALPTELSKGQNAEIVSLGGEGALDKRPGMSKVNTAAVSGSVLVVHDNPSAMLADKTATLYAGLYSGATGGNTWQKSTDGTTWTLVTTPALPFSTNSNIEGYWKNWPKCATVNGRMYFPDGGTTIGIHQWDGTNDVTLVNVPPAVVGALMGTPDAPTITAAPVLPLTTPTISNSDFTSTGGAGAEVWDYTYKIVQRLTSANSSGSTGTNGLAMGTGPLSASKFWVFTPSFVPQAGVTSLDVYRTVASSGQSTGKVGSITITASGNYTTGNGSGGPYVFSDKGLAGDATSPGVSSGVLTTYSYKVVAVNATGNSLLSASGTTASGYVTLAATGAYTRIDPVSPPVAGATSYDVYRTAGGAATGKVGSIPITAGAFTTGNGSGRTYRGTNYIFTDAALVGDGTTGPTAASGVGSANAQGILDVLTDGTTIQFAAQDSKAGTGTSINGRILSLDVASRNWTQLGAEFPITANGKGTAGALALFGGVFSYGTYIGTTSGIGSTGYTAATTGPLPAGMPEAKTLPDNHTVASVAVFNGELYIGTAVLNATGTARVDRRAANQSWTTVNTGPATGATSAYTSLAVFNGRLFAGWSSGGAAQASLIRSTADGVTWEAEYTGASTDAICQMTVFSGSLYVVLGRTGGSFNTTSSIVQRVAGIATGTNWTVVVTGAAGRDFAGCAGVVYV